MNGVGGAASTQQRDAETARAAADEADGSPALASAASAVPRVGKSDGGAYFGTDAAPPTGLVEPPHALKARPDDVDDERAVSVRRCVGRGRAAAAGRRSGAGFAPAAPAGASGGLPPAAAPIRARVAHGVSEDAASSFGGPAPHAGLAPAASALRAARGAASDEHAGETRPPSEEPPETRPRQLIGRRRVGRGVARGRSALAPLAAYSSPAGVVAAISAASRPALPRLLLLPSAAPAPLDLPFDLRPLDTTIQLSASASSAALRAPHATSAAGRHRALRVPPAAAAPAAAAVLQPASR